MTGHANRRLLVSIHDVGPAFPHQVEQLYNLLAEILDGPHFAMLVVPDHWGANPLSGNAGFARQLRGWAEQGIEMFVHGWYHKDLAEHLGGSAFKARYMTAGEGEFLGLSHDEAARRMSEGRDLIENIIGRETAGFIAPAWLYGEGALAALRESSFALAEDHMKVWQPQTGKILARGPVVTWASRSSMRTASSIAFAAIARQTLSPLHDVRVAVHPGDVTKDSLIASIRKTVKRFAKAREAGRYRDLLK